MYSTHLDVPFLKEWDRWARCRNKNPGEGICTDLRGREVRRVCEGPPAAAPVRALAVVVALRVPQPVDALVKLAVRGACPVGAVLQHGELLRTRRVALRKMIVSFNEN